MKTMGLYVVKLQHTSEACPTANTKARERMIKGAPEIPKLAQKLGIRFVAGPLVLGSTHESIAVVETDRIETVEEFILQAGLMQWNTIHVFAAKTLEESMKDLEKIPPPLY
jgi:hypothetical protein